MAEAENAVLLANQPATRCQMPINEAIASRLLHRQCRNRMARQLLCLLRGPGRTLTLMKRREFLEAAIGFVGSSTTGRLAKT
jgi:hypothetical protein